MEQLTRLAAQMQSRTSDLMNTEVSAVMDAITDGKYNRLWVDENLHVQLMSNREKISDGSGEREPWSRSILQSGWRLQKFSTRKNAR